MAALPQSPSPVNPWAWLPDRAEPARTAAPAPSPWSWLPDQPPSQPHDSIAGIGAPGSQLDFSGARTIGPPSASLAQRLKEYLKEQVGLGTYQTREEGFFSLLNNALLFGAGPLARSAQALAPVADTAATAVKTATSGGGLISDLLGDLKDLGITPARRAFPMAGNQAIAEFGKRAAPKSLPTMFNAAMGRAPSSLPAVAEGVSVAPTVLAKALSQRLSEMIAPGAASAVREAGAGASEAASRASLLQLSPKALLDRYGETIAKRLGAVEASQGHAIGADPRVWARVQAHLDAGEIAQAAELSKTYLANAASKFQRIVDEGGKIVGPIGLAKLGTTLAGGLVGGTQGETPSEHVGNALLGAGAGLFAGTVLHAYAAGSTEPLQQLMYAYLLGPVSLAKATVGHSTGALAYIAESLFDGNLGNVAKVLPDLAPPKIVGRFVSTLIDPAQNPLAKSVGQAVGSAEAPLSGVLSLPQRYLNAVNQAIRPALERSLGVEEAQRYLLLAEQQTTKAGQAIRAFGKPFLLRTQVPFSRIAANRIEAGLARTPLGLFIDSLQTPGPSALSKAVLGTASGIGAFHYASKIPDRWKPLVGVAAGVYGLPVAFGLIANKVWEQVATPQQALGELAREYSPLPTALTESANPSELGRTLREFIVPGALSTAAKALDTAPERETAPLPQQPGEPLRTATIRRLREAILNPSKVGVPGLRETLPVRPLPVDIFGQPGEDRSSALARAVFPMQRQIVKVPDDQLRDLFARLGYQPTTPRYERAIPVGPEVGNLKVPLTHSQSVEQQQFSRTGFKEVLQAIAGNPRFQTLPPALQRMVLKEAASIYLGVLDPAARAWALADALGSGQLPQ